jgi:hypothetical protein
MTPPRHGRISYGYVVQTRNNLLDAGQAQRQAQADEPADQQLRSGPREGPKARTRTGDPGPPSGNLGFGSCFCSILRLHMPSWLSAAISRAARDARFRKNALAKRTTYPSSSPMHSKAFRRFLNKLITVFMLP